MAMPFMVKLLVVGSRERMVVPVELGFGVRRPMLEVGSGSRDEEPPRKRNAVKSPAAR